MNRQRLTDTLAFPIQRLTRYALLLERVVHTATCKDRKLAMQSMHDKAQEANVALNYHLSNNDLRLQLTEIQNTIESYDAIDADEYAKLFPHHVPIVNLVAPMPLLPLPSFRRMFMRGDLKLKEGRASPKTDVHCILFTDMLLVCKSASRRADRLRVVKPPLHISSLRYTQFQEGSKCCIFFVCRRRRRACNLIYCKTLAVYKMRKVSFFSRLPCHFTRQFSHAHLILHVSYG